MVKGTFLRPKILVPADAGSRNGYRPRRSKQQLQEQLADRLGLEVMVSHYTTGASKWDPVEHRLFGPITINWAGKPLRTFEATLTCIRGTTTETGLKVKAFILDRHNEKGMKVSDQEMQALNLELPDTSPNGTIPSSLAGPMLPLNSDWVNEALLLDEFQVHFGIEAIA